jgi:hypothetical protein
MIDPGFELDSVEQSELEAIYGMPGFKVLLKVMQAAVEQARVDLDNADATRPQEVMAKHALSKATGVAVTRIMDRVNIEVSQFKDRPLASDAPKDETELAMDDIARITEHMPNLLGDVFIQEEG